MKAKGLFIKVFELVTKGYTIMFDDDNMPDEKVVKIKIMKNSNNKIISKVIDIYDLAFSAEHPEDATCKEIDSLVEMLNAENDLDICKVLYDEIKGDNAEK